MDDPTPLPLLLPTTDVLNDLRCSTEWSELGASEYKATYVDVSLKYLDHNTSMAQPRGQSRHLGRDNISMAKNEIRGFPQLRAIDMLFAI
jgi:hypothetical protein